ncbi:MULTISPECIES: hypothetical protein [Chloroflexus]|jgi:hypothetical protein|uniref:hypothetical protein n=1 Tax=Chloroflexus TaxID=1107 RepID=UPI0002E87AD4|nr:MULTISPECIES: hypothetical protein [Chloroflexus]
MCRTHPSGLIIRDNLPARKTGTSTPYPPSTAYRTPEPTRASDHHPAPAVPAPSGGGLGWGRVCTPCERAPPAR